MFYAILSLVTLLLPIFTSIQDFSLVRHRVKLNLESHYFSVRCANNKSSLEKCEILTIYDHKKE